MTGKSKLLRFWKKRTEMPGRWRLLTLEDGNRDESSRKLKL